MDPRSLWIFLLIQRTLATSENILKIVTPSAHANSEMLYDNYNENMLPLLSRDFTLLSQAIDMIEDNTCRDQCKLMVIGLRNLTTWAIKFYDASGKFPEGILGGSVYQLGNFDECLGIGAQDEEPQNITGQYCLGDVGIDVPEVYLKKNGSIWEDFRNSGKRYQEPITKLHWGICVPAACAPQDVEYVIRRVLLVAFSGSRLKLTPRIPASSCYKKESLSANFLDIAYICVILMISSIIVAGTIFHILYLRKKKDIPKRVLPQIMLSFSAISNLKNLCKPIRNDDLNLECICGIKFVAMFFIIAGHTLIFIISGPVLNKKFWDEAITKVENSIFLNNPLLVDTFLLLSGFLVCRILLRELDKRKSVNFFLLYVLRYIRLTPVYMVMIGLYMTWLPKLDSGPLWSRMNVERDRCLKSWWANILYINNYINTNNLCMFQSWYLSVDTQLFILAPAVVYLLWRWRRIGEFVLAGLTTISVLIPFTMTFIDNLDPTLMIYTAEVKDISVNEYFKNTYIKTHMRASAYCFGLVYGYFIYRIQTSGFKLSKNTVRLCWLLATTLLILSMSSISLFYGPKKDFTVIEAAFYASLHRALWSIGIGWILVACVTDNAGAVRSFLKWRPFVPLSRLTYSAYLVNGLIELHSVSTTRSPQYLDSFNLFKTVLAHLVLTFGAAVVLSTMFESPILALEKTLLRHGTKTTAVDKRNPCEDTVSTEA